MKLVPFSEVVVDMKRGPFGSAIKKEHFVPDGYKVYEQQNAIYDDHTLGRYFINTKKFKELEGFQVSPGDFLVSCSGTLGKVTRIPQNAAPGVINQALLRLRIDERKIDPVFFLHLFRSEWVQGKFVSGAKGVAIKNFAGVKELKQIEVPLFSIEQQKKISEKIESLFAEIDSGTQELQSAKQKLELYKQSVLNSAIQGKLVPQDAKDEPVLKLLERIRAEKEKLIKEKKLKEKSHFHLLTQMKCHLNYLKNGNGLGSESFVSLLTETEAKTIQTETNTFRKVFLGLTLDISNQMEASL